jgi:hypothetical protein
VLLIGGQMSSNQDAVESSEDKASNDANGEAKADDGAAEDKNKGNAPTDASASAASQKRKRTDSGCASPSTNIPESATQSTIPHWLAGQLFS